MASPSSIISLGLGSWGSPSDVITLGYGIGIASSYTKNSNLSYMITPELALLLGHIRMSNWNTAGRPSGLKSYSVGYNTDTQKLELWDGASWITL